MTVEVLQLYYTSCEQGVSGYAGFQTRAMSAGIDLTEQRELERLCLYVVPRHLPPEPDDATISEHFPVPIKTVTLSTGRRAVVRCRYVGQDYSGRWGNYFAHALVIPRELDDVWPMDLASSVAWRDGLHPGEGSTEPSALPPMPAGSLAAIPLDTLSEFLRMTNHGHLLPVMLRAVFQRTQDARSLVIRAAAAEDAVTWINCLQRAFPVRCLGQLTAATYQADPAQCLHINGTYGSSDFLFNETEMKYQFYMFDLVDDRHSEVPEVYTEYVDQVSTWMRDDPSTLGAFQEFAKLFSVDELNEDLIHLLRLFRGSHDGGPTLQREDLHKLIDFMSRSTTDTGWERALDALDDVVSQYAHQALNDDWVRVARLLTEATRRSGRSELDERLYSLVSLAVGNTSLDDADWRWAFDECTELSSVERMSSTMVDTLIRSRREERIGKTEFAAGTRAVGLALGPCLERLGDAERWAYLKRLTADGPSAMVVIGEWGWRLRTARDPLEVHQEYERRLLTAQDEFTTRWSGFMRQELWNTLDDSRRPLLAARWVATKMVATFGPELAAAVLNTASLGISLNLEDEASSTLARQINALTEDDPPRVSLRLALDGIREGDLHVLISLRDALRRSETTLHSEVLNTGLDVALRAAHSATLHGAVIEAFYQNENPAFLDAYRRFWSRRGSGGDIDAVDEAAVIFWLTVDTNPSFADRLKAIRSAAFEAVARRVGNLDADVKTSFFKALSAQEFHSGNIETALSDFVQYANSLKTPWWKRLLGG